MHRVCAALLSIATAAATPAMAAPPAAQSGQDRAVPARTFGRVAFDARSLMIDGHRQLIWSAEFHPFRLPSPDLWRDVLQKLKASGFNTVSLYFDWGYHSPKAGVYDFSGIRDVDRVLTMAAEEGLYVITRAGPYVNAELSRGGFPGWLVNQRGKARTDDPAYLAAADEWLTRIDAIIARHQINGDGHGHRGTVILHQIENELAVTGPAQQRYMDHLYAKVRTDGITVPVFHNDQSRNGYWVPAGAAVARTVPGPADLYAFDGYPGGTCTVTGRPTHAAAAPDWGFYGVGGARGGASASPGTPGFIAEFGGGWFDYWGSNGSYGCTAIQRGRRYQRVFYGTNLANGIAIHNIYMGYGGTSWGWLPAPVVFTSYDYGAAIAEDRSLRDKAAELRQLGGLIAAVPDLAGMVPALPVTVSSSRIYVYHDRNPETDARFLMVTHMPSDNQADDRFTIAADLPDGHYVFPQAAPMRLDGFDAKWLIAGVTLGGQRLVYSTSELQTALRVDGADLLVLYGRSGEDGETVLRYAAPPQVDVIEGHVGSTFDAARGDLRLNYAHRGRAVVRLSGGGRPPATLILADEAEGARYWRADSQAGAVLVRGPALVRHAAAAGSTLTLTGDTAAATPLELWAPVRVARLRWNGVAVPLARGVADSRVAMRDLDGPKPLTLPALDSWRIAEGSPEARVDFDDHDWQPIDRRAAATITAKPDGEPTMVMDAYGFHDGDVWYSGRFTGTAEAQQLALFYGAGGAGLVQVFLDGRFVGQDELATGLPRPITTGLARIDLPETARLPGEHVLAVMVRNNGHNWDLDGDDYHKEARGLVSASLGAAGGRSFAVPIAWRIQGSRGGEDLPDPARGPANTGGQYGERFGWHLPGFDDARWRAGPLAGTPAAGTTWYRTHVRLAVPAGQDATIALAFGDVDRPRSTAQYRALIFVNGWNMGQFIAHVGPQRLFPVPEGIMNHHGDNVVALAVTSDGRAGNGPEPVRLVTMQTVRGGVPVRMVEAPVRPADLTPPAAADMPIPPAPATAALPMQ